MHDRQTIAFLIELSSAYGRGLLWGVRAYIRRHANWNVVVPDLCRIGFSQRSLQNRQCDGAIVRVDSEATARIVRTLGIPAINVGPPALIPEMPSVHTDDQAVASMAFAHLYEQGFRHFAYCGMKGNAESERQLGYFTKCCHTANLECHAGGVNDRQAWQKRLKSIGDWLGHLPRPLAILAKHDGLAREVLDASRAAEIRVPQEVAVVGVGNDEFVCELAEPQLSSVAPDIERIGFQAAQYLHRRLQGDTEVPLDTLIRPTGVIARRSTDSLAIDDPNIAAAVRYIRNNAVDGIKVADVLKVVPISRRVLEKGFRTFLGRTPHQEILNVQIRQVESLLRETDLSMERIASQTGFRHTEYMSVAFKRETGKTPSAYRQHPT